MTMLKKNGFGISFVVFMLLISIYSANAAVDVSRVSYVPVSGDNWEQQLNNHINQAKSKGQKFYIGVACAQFQQKTTQQTLCSRQGSKPFGDRCGGESNHHKDVEVVKEKWGVKLTKVYYPKAFKSKTEVYAIEKRLIATYFNTGRVDPLCLNRHPGKDSCSNDESKGIVYLRVYEEGNSVYSDEL